MRRARRVLGYARVSSEEQAKGTSLSDQQNVIRTYAKANGLDVAKIYVEAESAVHEKIERREQIRALLEQVRDGDLVLVDKIDRWSRDPEFSYSSIRQILGAGARFYAIGDNCDPSTPDGDTMLNFRILFAREEHKRIKVRMVGTRMGLRDQGYYSEGVPPFGYRRKKPEECSSRLDKLVLVLHEEEAAIVRRVFAMCIAGRSMSQIAAEFDLKLDRVKDILDRRIYLGAIKNSHGQWIQGKHPPIIDADTFTRARASIASRRHAGPKTPSGEVSTADWILRDIARCGLCNGKIGSAWAGLTTGRRNYYRCWSKCQSKGSRVTTGSYLRVSDTDAEAGLLVLARLGELRDELSRPPKTDRKLKAAVVDLSDRRKRLEEKRARLVETYAEGLTTKEQLRSSLSKVDDDLIRLSAQEQAETKRKPVADVAVRREVLREVSRLEMAWRKMKPQAKRKVVNLLATAVHLAPNHPPRFTWRSSAELAEVFH